jgi:hypothetical protein
MKTNTKNPPQQGQHIISDAYLSQFAFRTKGNHKKIKVIQRGYEGVREVSVSIFNREFNYFDIESDNPEIERLFENFNGPLETQYPKIINELSSTGSLEIQNASYLIHFTGNLISRSLMWREEILEVLKTEDKSNFIKEIIAPSFENQEELDRIEESELFINLNRLTPENLINRILVFFNEYLFQRFQYFDMIFFRAPVGKSWFTTNNPVLLENHIGKFNFLTPESEVYFPLSLEYLVFICCSNSNNQSNPLRKYQVNAIHDFPESMFDELNHKIVGNTTDYVVCPPECETTTRTYNKPVKNAENLASNPLAPLLLFNNHL